MSVAANQVITRRDEGLKDFPVAASTHLYQGTLAFINTDGNADDDTASGVNQFGGLVRGEVDNSGGAAGDKSVELHREGVHTLSGTGFTQATVGLPIYATDNFTVTSNGAASGAVYIGICTGYVSSTKIEVEFDFRAITSLTSSAAITTQVITVNGGTGVNYLAVPDNLAKAFEIREAANVYLTVVTTNGAESLSIPALTASVVDFLSGTGVNEIHIPTNLADALSVEVAGVGDLILVDTTTGSVAITVTTSAAAGLTLAGHVTVGDAKNIILNATTGTKIGTATTQKLGFFNATPIVQRAAWTQTYSTADKTVANPLAAAVATTAATNSTPYGFAQAQADAIVTAINNLVLDMADTKQAVNALIDDLQALGLVG